MTQPIVCKRVRNALRSIITPQIATCSCESVEVCRSNRKNNIMHTNLDATEKEEVLSDAKNVFLASQRGMLSCMEFERRLQGAGFDYRFINETLGELRSAPR